MLNEAGAASVVTAVAVDKRRADALLEADHAAFTNVEDFIVGYGMDDGETGRALPISGECGVLKVARAAVSLALRR